MSKLLSEPSGELKESAWSEVERSVRWYARRILYSRGELIDEDDIVQEILLDLQNLSLRQRLKLVESPEAYMITIIKNKANDISRRHTSENRSLANIPPQVGSIEMEEEYGGGTPDWYELLEDELKHLKKTDRELLRMRFWKNMAISEISDELKQPYSRVAVRLFRLLRKMRTDLLRQG